MPQEIIRNVRIENLSSPIVTAQILNSGAYGTNHSSLINLSEDDHLQYFNEERGDLRYLKLSEYSKDHSSLINLNADDHPQYFNIARGDIRYLKLSEYFQGHIIENEGIPLIQRTNLNFVGGGVTVTDNGSDTSIITIPDASIDKLCQINDVYCYTGTSSVSGSGSGQSALPECIPADGSILIYDCDAVNPGWYPSPQQQLPTVLFTDVDGEGTLRYVTPDAQPNVIDDGTTDSYILSGRGNRIQPSGFLNTIVTGSGNEIYAYSILSVISGGIENKINGNYGFIAGGYRNEIAGFATGSSILGGWESYVAGDYSVASGKNASTATYNGTFVFADSTTNVRTIIPNANDQFAIKAAGGLRLIDGQQGANKVLTSDANGVGHWSDPTGSTGSSTLNAVGAGSTTLSDSTYTLTNNVDVKFNSSEGNPIFKLDESAESILIGADSHTITGRENKLYIEGDGNTTLTRTQFAVKNTGPASAAAFDMICSDGGAISIQASGPGYGGGHKAWVYSYEGLPLYLASDGNVQNGGLNDISFSPGGWDNTSVWFKPSGNVGIGTSSPSTKLEVAGQVKITGGNPGANKVLTSDATGLASWVLPTGGTGSVGTLQTVTNNGNTTTNSIGINISTPSAKLHVSNDDVTVNAGLISGTAPTSLVSGNGTAINSTIVAGSSSFNRPVFQGRRSRGTLTAPSAVINNDYIMSFVASGYDGSASQFGAAIDFFADANVTNGNVPTRISFSTGSNSSSRLERLTIKSDGDIGIGTTLPTARLHALAGSVAEMKFSSGALGITPALSVGNTNASGKFATLIAGTNGAGLWFDQSGYFSIASASKADYSSNGLGVTQDIRFRVDGATGNVGIGTTSSTAKLEVAGQVKITGGSPGTGKVLTSDATGLASWQSAGTGAGPIAINDLTDVDTSTSVPNNGESLVWNSTASKWEPSLITGGTGSVGTLQTVTNNGNTTTNPIEFNIGGTGQEFIKINATASSGRPLTFYDNGSFVGGIDYNFAGNYWSFDVSDSLGSRVTDAFTIQSETDDNFIGFGTTLPDAKLHINASAINGRETLLKGSISDAGDDAFYLGNGTAGNGSFMPRFAGYVNSSNGGYSQSFWGMTNNASDASDSSSFGLTHFAAMRSSGLPSDPTNGTLSEVQNRKLFTFGGAGANIYMTMAAGGNVGFGTSTPEAKVDVNGRMRFQSTTASAPTAGRGFEAFYSTGSDKSFFISIDRDPSTDILKGIDMRGSDIEFWTGADLNNDAVRLKIEDDGVEFLQNVRILNSGGQTGAPAFRCLDPANANFRIQSSLRNGSQNTSFNIDAVGQPGDVNRETLVVGYFQNPDKYKIASVQTGSGVLHPIRFEMGWDAPVMTIATDGNIGIGTETPDKALNITGSGAKSTLKITDNGTGSAAAEMYIGSNDGWSFFNERSTKNFNFRETITGGSIINVDRLTIQQGGNIGIGTTSPTAKLEVAGQVKITGGSPGTGKVLTSDAGGTASWVLPTGGTVGDPVAAPTAETSIYIDAGGLLGTDGGASASTGGDAGTNNSTDWWNVDVTEELFSKIAMPPQWDGGDVDVEFFWTINGANTGDNVQWGAAATSAGNGEVWDSVFSAVTETGDDLLIANDEIHVVKATGITPAGTPADGNLLFLKLQRTSTTGQTASADARLLGVRVHYKNLVHRNWYINKMGGEDVEADAIISEKTAWIAPANGIIYGVHSGVSTIPSAAGISIDVKAAGNSILSVLGVIAAGESSSDQGSSTSHVIQGGSYSFSKGDRISFEIDSFGGTGGKGLHTDLQISWAQ